MLSPFILVIAGALVALLLCGLLIWRARKPLVLPKPDAGKKGGGLSGHREAVKKTTELFSSGLTALRYLCTPHQWRYQAPWVLMLGPAAAGKTSIAASLKSGRRQSLLLRERGLPIEGTEWRFSNEGVLIDPAGAFACAEPESAEGKRWRKILVELDNRRPERPLDAVVLAVSAATLLRGSAKERDAAAALCYRQLWTLQKRFEFALPVYVVVSQCDSIDGFAAYWCAQRSARAQEIVGWSNPALIDGAPAEWMDAAFERLGEGLRSLQVDAAAQARDIADVDRFFLFPARFDELRAPLQAFLETVFQPSAYHASFFFRGVYFAGSVAADGAAADKPRSDVVFVEDLFDKRIFAESHLARPTRQGLWSRNRLVRNLQIAGVALLGALCLALGHAAYRLHRDVDALVASLYSLRVLQAERFEAKAQAGCHDRESVYALIAAIARIEARMAYLAIPVSWFDRRLASDAGKTIAERSFVTVIFPALRCRLESRARTLAGIEPQGGSASALAAYVAQAGAFEQNLERYEHLIQQDSAGHVDELMGAFAVLLEYAYDAPPPEEMQRERGALSRALVRTRYSRSPTLPADLRKVVAGRVARGAREVREALLAQAAWGATGLQALERREGALPDNVRRLNAWLDWVRADWLQSSEKANACRKVEDELRAALTHLPRAKYGGFDGVLADFDAKSCYRPARQSLVDMRDPQFNPVFRASGDALEIAIADDLRGLPALAAQPFMQRRGETPFDCRRAVGGWSAGPVADAQRFVREYQQFARTQGVAAAAAALGKPPFYDRVARGALRAVLDETLNGAQRPEETLMKVSFNPISGADQELSRASAEFVSLLDPLLQVLRTAQQLGLEGQSSVVQCARDFAAAMLLRVEALGASSRLYDPEAEAARSEAPEERFFPLGNEAITRDYLALQQRRTEVLAGYAAPFAAFLKNTDAVNDGDRRNAQRASYWDNTVAELARSAQFKEKTSGQVALLESFFVKQLAVLTEDNCGKLLGGYQEAAHGNDLFSERRRALEAQAHDVCSDREQATVYTQYRDIANRFNRELAGLYPFSGADARDASHAVVKSFFMDYENQKEALRKSVAALEGDLGRDVKKFVGELDAAAAFFRTNLAAGEASQPLKVDVAFRELAAQSPGSEQIIEWQLRAGERIARYPGAAASLDHVFGSPVALELLWAAQSSYGPLPAPSQPDLRVRDATASFSANGAWALLRLTEAHRPRSVPSFDPLDPNRALLEFIVPVSSKAGTASMSKPLAARVYMALHFSGRDPKTQAPAALKLPAAFPRSAPVTW